VVLRDERRPVQLVDVVGPICETGDFLALERPLPAVEPGERVAILCAGAYGFVMGSTYNARPRPPEVVVDEGRWGIARPREALEDLMHGELVTPLANEAP
jgi:diaminopimelate decarboxylase